MKTIVVSHLPDVSGPLLSMWSRIEALRSSGTVVLVVPEQATDRLRRAPVDEIRELAYSPLTLPASPLRLPALFTQLRRQVMSLRACFRCEEADLVVVLTSFLPHALAAARLEGIKSICYVGESLARDFRVSPARATSGRLLGRLVGSCADGLICCSEVAAAPFRSNSVPILVSNPPVCSPLLHDRDALQAEWTTGTPCVASIGSISRGRGQDVLLRALPAIRERYPDVLCLIVGGPHNRRADLAYQRELVALAAELEISDSVVFTGFVNAVGGVYAAADIVVNPIRVPEGFGRVGIEAHASGVPIVSTAFGGIREALTDGADALFVPPDDPPQLSDSIIRLTSDRALRERLIEGGLRRAAAQPDEDFLNEQLWSLLSAMQPTFVSP